MLTKVYFRFHTKIKVPGTGRFIYHHKKSVFCPVQKIEWFGIYLNSIEFNISNPERRIKDVEETLSKFIDL